MFKTRVRFEKSYVMVPSESIGDTALRNPALRKRGRARGNWKLGRNREHVFVLLEAEIIREMGFDPSNQGRTGSIKIC